MTGAAVGLCAIALLRKFAAAQETMAASDMLTDDAWDDAYAEIELIAMQARCILSEFDRGAGAVQPVPGSCDSPGPIAEAGGSANLSPAEGHDQMLAQVDAIDAEIAILRERRSQIAARMDRLLMAQIGGGRPYV